MSITKDIPVPTSYTRLHESKTLFGIHDRLMFVRVILIVIAAVILMKMYEIGVKDITYFLIVILIFVGFVLAIARDVKTLDRSKLYVLLLFRIMRKKHITAKYIEPIDDLKRIVPIDSVEDSGLIRYTDDSSGVLVLYNPMRTPDSEIDSQSSKMKGVINSLYGGFTFQFLSNSIVEVNNPLTSTTTEAMKIRDTPQQITKHLHSLYEESTEQRENIDWEFTLLVTIPVSQSIEDAEKLRNAFMSGLLKSLSRSVESARVVEERNEVIRILRSHLC